MTVKRVLPILFVLVWLLAACGSEATSPAPAADLAASAVLDLPDTIDVQTVAQIKERADVTVIDVREQWEYDEGHIPGVVHIPMNEVPNRLAEIPADGTVVLTCRSGNRSSQVTQYLRDNGYENVHNMQGGITAWQNAGLAIDQ